MAAGIPSSQADPRPSPATGSLMGGRTLNESMLREVLELSTFFDPDPRAVYARIVDDVAAHYSGTAMLNLLEGDRLRYHYVMSDIPALRTLTTLPLQDTF